MGEWIDFGEIRAKVSLENVLLGVYGLGERLKRSGRKLIGPCPVHGGDNPRAFQADLEKNVWYCHTGCQRGGNVIDLVAAIERVPIRDAALKLHAAYLAESASLPAKAPAAPATASGASAARAPPAEMPAKSAAAVESSEEAINPPLTLRLSLAHDHPHLLKDRGLAMETAAAFGAGYCARGLLRGMIAIPIADEDGDLVAYAGRRLKAADVREHGKYRFPARFRKDLVLYNLDRVRCLDTLESVVLVEGFFAVMTLHERGVPGVVASMGCSLSEAQADLLAAYAQHVAILYDGNAAGQLGADGALTLLEKRGTPATRIVPPDGAVPEDLSARLIRWAVSGGRVLGLREISFTPNTAARAAP